MTGIRSCSGRTTSFASVVMIVQVAKHAVDEGLDEEALDYFTDRMNQNTIALFQNAKGTAKDNFAVQARSRVLRLQKRP
jgi:hypothetical protein